MRLYKLIEPSATPFALRLVDPVEPDPVYLPVIGAQFGDLTFDVFQKLRPVRLVIGSLIGEGLRIEYWLERFGQVLQEAAYKAPVLAPGRADQPGEKGHTLVEGFVTASLLFCVGAMTVLGSIQDGLGDPSLLYLKALLDGIASIALATTLGAGVGLSVIPIIIIQGGIAAGAHSVESFMTPEVIASIQAVGGALILAIGFDLAGVKRLPVGNMLPAILVGALAVGFLT